MVIEKRLEELDIILPNPAKPAGSYALSETAGDLLFLSGTGGSADGRSVFGKLGREVTIDEGYASARGAVINYLGIMKDKLGDLDRVESIVKLLCFINCTSDFSRQPEVADGASDLLLEVFGKEKGLHARSAVGVSSLPFNIPVEIEMIVKIRNQDV